MAIIYESIQKCRICDNRILEEVLNLGAQPLANSICDPKDSKLPGIPLRLLFCSECKSVQLGESVNPQNLFSKYVWVTGTSQAAESHSKYFFHKALSHGNTEKPYVVEIASNDGTFLKPFKEADCKVLGIDPANNIAEIAVKNGIPTLVEFFDESIANQLVKDEGLAEIIIARNVIPHVKEIHSVIEGISILLDDNGIGIIEFHDAGLILKGLQYDSIYHEHLFYFSLQTICFLLKQHGLHVYDLTSSPISGGAWMIYFSKHNQLKTSTMNRIEEQETSNGVNRIESWIDFADKTKQHKYKLQEIIYNQNKKILAYGASARSSTLLNYCEIDNNHISSVIDKNPLKHGMLTPGSHIPIISFEQGIKDMVKENKILLLAWNFENEIISDLKSHNFNGEFIIPLPNQTRIR
jgi:hypothetical protein